MYLKRDKCPLSSVIAVISKDVSEVEETFRYFTFVEERKTRLREKRHQNESSDGKNLAALKRSTTAAFIWPQ